MTKLIAGLKTVWKNVHFSFCNCWMAFFTGVDFCLGVEALHAGRYGVSIFDFGLMALMIFLWVIQNRAERRHKAFMQRLSDDRAAYDAWRQSMLTTRHPLDPH